MRKTALLLILLAAGAFPAAAPGAKSKVVRAAQQLPHEAIALTSGVEATYSLPSVTSATLWNGNLGFSIVVPSGATQLRVEINGPSNADVDLYIRYGLDVTVSGGDVVADYFSEGLTSSESITIPSPRAGTYFIAFGLYTNGVTVTGRILGTVTGGGGTGGGGSGGGSGGGATITGITLSGGSFSSSGLINNGSYWDTIPSTSSWVLGVSAPSVSSPLLNAANKSVNIPAGTYYTYNEPASFGTAVQIAINWSDGRPNDVAIFQVASLVTFGNWTRLSGSTAISLAATGITNANRVALGLTSGGANDNVLQLTVGSPAGGGGTGGTGAGANLLTNGGFELPGNNGSYISLGTGSPGLTGWRITAGDLDYIGNLWTPSEGKSSLDMNGVSAATIAQTFATVEGTTYTVSFDLAGNPAGGPAIKTLRSLAAGQSRDFQFDATSKSFTSMGWIRQSWTFTANSSSTVLSFESRIGGIYGPALDNVVVTGPGSGGSPALQLSFNGIDAGGRVNFLPVNVGRTATVSLTVRNPGTAPVTVISISSTNPVFSATPQTLMIEPGGTRPLDVSFLPVAERSELGVMTLNLAGGGTAVLNLSGSGVAAPGGSGGGNAGSNLLQNGGADAAAVTGCGIPASIPGWNTDGRVAVCSYAAGGGYPTAADPGPPARGANFFAGGRSATSSMNQTVSLAANAAQIETGSFPYTLSAYLGGFAGDTDNARITLTFLRENGTVTGTAIIGPVTPADRANRTGLFLRSTGGNVPTGTRSARVTVDFTRGSGDANDGYADDISFALGAGGGTSGGGTGGGTGSGCPSATNIALTGTASQSSVGFGGVPSLGNNGVINEPNQFGFHTAFEPSPWWQVDLGTVSTICEVVMHNRLDGFWDRAKTIRVLLSTDGVNFQVAYAHNGTTWGTNGAPPLTVSTEVRNKLARYVRVQLNETEYLHLREVQVYGILSAGGGGTPAPTFSFDPSSLTFQASEAGATKLVRAINNSSSTVSITGVSSSNPSFGVTMTLPAATGPGSFNNVPVRFSPTGAGTHNATITLTTNPPIAGAQFTVTGTSTGGGTTPPGTTPGCNYLVSLNPSSPTRIDGTRQTGLITIFTGAACDWTASFNDSWITIEAGRSGRGPGAVSYRAEANPDARERTGTMTVAGQTFTFIQGAGAPCTYTIAPESLPAPVAATGGGGAIVLTTGATCAWAASSNASWLSANPPSGAGGRTLQWTASPNTSATGRTGVITFTGGRTFTVIQSPAGASGGPNVTPGGVVGAASGIPPSLPGGALALGSFFSIFAEGVGPNPPVQATSFPLPTNLGGTSVRIRQGNSSVDAYLVFSSASQINGIVPSNAPLGDAELIVTFNGRSTPPVAVRTVRNNLGIFSVGGGRGPGIIQNFIAPTDQPLNTRNATAKPRQIITLWGTGAGPINTPDNVAPPVGDLPYEFELQIGGKRARLLYNGRAPCCSGVDQIVAEIPADVPFGCSVPVQARAGELWSNTVTMAISADGSPCSDPRNPLASIPQSGGKIGVVSLLRAGASLRTAEGLQTLSVDLGVGLFTDVAAGGELGFSPLTALPPPGSCQTYASTQDLTSLISGALPGGTLNGAKMLNAGSQLTVTPSGGRALPLARTDDGTYLGLLGGGIPGLGSTPLVLNAGTFRIAGPGGADVGNFQVDVTLGPPLVWSNREQLTSIDRRQPFDITWTGGGADQNVLIAGLSSDQTTKATAVFVCLAPAAAGRFSVPPSAMSNLPTAPAIADFEKRFGLVVVGSLRTGNFPVFSAQGIGSGIVMPASLDMRTVEVK